MRAYLFTTSSPATCVSGYHSICSEDHLIAVDGGLAKIDELGLIPHLLIGDLDSVPSTLLEKYAHIPCQRFGSEKNETDTELALAWCLAQKCYHEIIILNDLQGRFDHCLGLIQNLLLAHEQNPGISVRIESQSQVLFMLKPVTELSGYQDALLSLVALSSKAEIASSSGLKYSLHNLQLFPHLSRGISNLITDPTASIVLHEGKVLAVLTPHLSL